ncbi:MAG: hypothetical protein RPU51_14315 [Candidatus Sedimenticola sp. (ex Thyasira tokunagai)]
MESRIPIPTDNIFKFYAMFGLLLLITSIMGTIWVSTSTNEKLHSLVKEYEGLAGTKEEKEKSDLAKVIEIRMNVQAENKKTFKYGLSAITGMAFWLMVYGFWQWHTKIQPKQDEYFELQLQKLRQENKSSNK